MRTFLFLSAFLFPGLALALPPCPPMMGQDTVTFSAIMVNYGRFTMSADTCAFKGNGSPSALKNIDVNEAIAKLDVAISCTQLAQQNMDLLPTRANDLVGEGRDRYVKAYVQMTKNYEKELVRLQDGFKDLLLKPEGQRDTAELYALSQKIKEQINKAHTGMTTVFHKCKEGFAAMGAAAVTP